MACRRPITGPDFALLITSLLNRASSNITSTTLNDPNWSKVSKPLRDLQQGPLAYTTKVNSRK